MRRLFAVLALITIVWSANATCTKRVLVAMSSASELPITMPNGTTGYVPIGFFFDELMIPLLALMTAGYQPTFANPKGNR
jgi:hypothetical protein